MTCSRCSSGGLGILLATAAILVMRTSGAQARQFGADQTWSPFMDPDIFPNSYKLGG